METQSLFFWQELEALRPNGEFDASRPPEILVIEDDSTMSPLMEHIAHDVHPSANLTWTSTPREAEDLIEARLASGQPHFDLIIADIFLSDRQTGIDIWHRYQVFNMNFLIISATTPAKFHQMIGPTDHEPLFLPKPIDPTECAEVIRFMLRDSRPA